jgi:hypothetical protein
MDAKRTVSIEKRGAFEKHESSDRPGYTRKPIVVNTVSAYVNQNAWLTFRPTSRD